MGRGETAHDRTIYLRKSTGAMSIWPQQVRIIHECRREAFETEARMAGRRVDRVQACRSGESTIAAETSMNNAG